MTFSPPQALLLLGPTGVGKTPLGHLIEQRGLWDTPFRQFDFGATLRTLVARGTPDSWVSAEDIAFLRGVLQTGALLEDAHFPLARRILESFLQQHQDAPRTRIVLNGLPRHVGQAASLEAIVDVRWVVSLACTAETVLARIAGNVGGDRLERTDDDPQAVRRKLEIFAQRTAPLVAHYQQRGARIFPLEVSATATPLEMWQRLESCSIVP